MPEPRKQLPAALVGTAGYKLIRAFSRAEDMSISDAIRQLIKESPRLIEFAERQGIDVSVIDVNPWGRTADIDEDEEPSIEIVLPAIPRIPPIPAQPKPDIVREKFTDPA